MQLDNLMAGQHKKISKWKRLSFQMKRVASIKSDLKGVESLYILEITLPTG